MAAKYVVKSGDTLSKIAKEHLGDASRWPEIYEANKHVIKDPNVIAVGLELDIPADPGSVRATKKKHDFE